MDLDPVKVEACARAAHEANRNFCYATGDGSQPPWEDAPDWQRQSAIAGVAGALAGRSPKESHEAWCELKVADGWTYGETKDAEKKTHPCLVPYGDLPGAQKMKDDIYLATVRATAIRVGLVGLPEKPEPTPSAQELYARFVTVSGGEGTWVDLAAKARGNWEAVAASMTNRATIE